MDAQPDSDDVADFIDSMGQARSRARRGGAAGAVCATVLAILTLTQFTATPNYCPQVVGIVENRRASLNIAALALGGILDAKWMGSVLPRPISAAEPRGHPGMRGVDYDAALALCRKLAPENQAHMAGAQLQALRRCGPA